MAVTDGSEFPIGVLVESAQKAEAKLAEVALETVCIARQRGRPRTRPERLTYDRGYSGPTSRGGASPRDLAEAAAEGLEVVAGSAASM